MYGAVKQSLGVVFECSECPTPAVEVVDGYLVIEHRHHGQKHTTRILLKRILDKVITTIVE